MPPINDLIDKSRRYLASPHFIPLEMDYKLALAQQLNDARQAFADRSSDAFALLKRAIQSSLCNIIDWRTKDQFRKWHDKNSKEFTQSLRGLWNEVRPLDERLASYTSALARNGIDQTGSQLTVTSTLLMALGPLTHPPIRTDVFKTAGAYERPGEMSALQRYLAAIKFLDCFIVAAKKRGLQVEDRLVAQGLLWCATGHWSKIDVGEWTSLIESDLTAEGDIKSAMRQLKSIKPTTRQSIIDARLGQGQFRRDLLNYWHGCSVTGCTNTRVLRASHLKSWRDSSNAERLDGFNGLLLVPNLDLALDQLLITFTDQGVIIISDQILEKDRQSLGIAKKLRLRRVEKSHIPYLRWHRALFEKNERSGAGSRIRT